MREGGGKNSKKKSQKFKSTKNTQKLHFLLLLLLPSHSNFFPFVFFFGLVWKEKKRSVLVISFLVLVHCLPNIIIRPSFILSYITFINFTWWFSLVRLKWDCIFSKKKKNKWKDRDKKKIFIFFIWKLSFKVTIWMIETARAATWAYARAACMIKILFCFC